MQLEALALKEQYLGSQTRLYDLVEAVSDMCPSRVSCISFSTGRACTNGDSAASNMCPEQSVMHLIQYR